MTSWNTGLLWNRFLEVPSISQLPHKFLDDFPLFLYFVDYVERLWQEWVRTYDYFINLCPIQGVNRFTMILTKALGDRTVQFFHQTPFPVPSPSSK